MARKIMVDTSRLEGDTRRLAAGLTSGGKQVAVNQAATTAAAIRGKVPVRTGRLASTVGTVDVAGGAGVTYGGGLPYAPVVEKRQHPVRKGARGSRVAFYRALQALAAAEVGKI